MELLLLAGSWWIIGFSGAMMPGPVTTLVVTETARRGFIAGPLITLGHSALEFVMVVALFFGLGDLLKQNAVAGSIGLIGGLFLLWMGLDIVRNAWQGKVALNTTARQGGGAPGNAVVAGVLTSASNPYWWLWWATVGALYLTTFRAFGIAGIVTFYVGHSLADWVWNDVVAFIVATGRRAMSDRVYRGILLVCGAFLIGLSFYFVFSGIGFLRG